jgi:hypothetical protein
MVSVLFVDDEPARLTIGKTFQERTCIFKVDTLKSTETVLASENPLQYDTIAHIAMMPCGIVDMFVTFQPLQPKTRSAESSQGERDGGSGFSSGELIQ